MIIELFIDIMDAGVMNDAYLQAFAGGYGMDKSAFEQLRVELEAYLLLKSFDLVRWAIDRRPSSINHLAQRAREIWHWLQSTSLGAQASASP